MSHSILVPVSGGKDSQACLKLACEKVGSDNVIGLFCDTKFEHPDTYNHVKWMSENYKVQIDWVNNGSVIEKSLQFKRFPGGGSRHCTDRLKIQETKKYLKNKSEKEGGFEVWYGMRADESPERAKRYSKKIGDDLYEPHEIMPSSYPKYLGKNGVKFRLPILEWSRADVFEYLNGEEHPHYSKGFDRVGCFPCLAGGDKAKLRAFQYDDFGREQYKKVIWLGEQIGKSVWTSKKMKEDENQGCLICSI